MLNVNRNQTEVEVIDSLSFAIVRQSGACVDFLKHAVAVERAECAAIADREARTLRARSDESGSRAAEQVAALIRARTEQFQSGVLSAL
jgi:hypothetical protein